MSDEPVNEPIDEELMQEPIEEEAQDPRIEELTNALQRERADAVNMRRQHERSLQNMRQQSVSRVVSELLPVFDDLERALKHVPEDLVDNEYVKGIQGVVKKFDKTLNNIGVSRIPTVGEEFDPNLHEAVSMKEGQGSREVVCEELVAGYRFGDEVIRPAMVNVEPAE